MVDVIQGQTAGILDIYLRFNGVLTDANPISYNIAEPSGTLVASGVSPFKRSTGVYDARTTTIPSGFSLTDSWIITWTFTSPDNVTSSSSQEFIVLASAPLVAGTTDLITQIKLDLDIAETKYTTAQYHVFITKALNRLNRRLAIKGIINTLTFPSAIITPTPDSALNDIILLQVECLIVKTNRSNAVKKGIRVKSGDQEIDTVAGFGGHSDIVNDICGELSRAIIDYIRCKSDVGTQGRLVTYADQEIIIDHSHNGQSDAQRNYESPFDNC